MSKAARRPVGPFRKLLSLELVLFLALLLAAVIYDVRTTCVYVIVLPTMLMLELGSSYEAPKTVKRLRWMAARYLGLLVIVFSFGVTQRRSELGRLLDLCGFTLMLAIVATGWMIAKTEWFANLETP